MNKENPWHPLISYNETDKDSFYGRNIEIGEFLNIIDNELISTLYGKSGIGKSSLLKAGVFPRLRMNNYYPLYIRLSNFNYIVDNKCSYCANIIDTIEKTEDLTIEHNVDTENNELTLWEYFHTSTFRNNKKEEVYPVIVLDQFEETLLNNNLKAKELLLDLYSLISNNHRTDSCDNYKADTNYRFVISIREDCLYLLEDIIEENKISILKENRYRLRALKKETAQNIIKTVGKDFIREEIDVITEDLVKYILSYNHNGCNEIEPLILSLLCYMIFEENKSTGIRKDEILKLKNKNPLIDYYNKAISSISRREVLFIEEQMISIEGRRITVSEKNFKANIKEIDTAKYPLFVKNANNYEIAHDIMAEAIFNVKKENRAKEKTRKIKKAIYITFSILAFYVLLTIIRNNIENLYSYKESYIANDWEEIFSYDFRKGNYGSVKELHINENIFNKYGTYFPNLKTLYFGDNAKLFADISPLCAPKLNSVVFNGRYCDLKGNTKWFENITDITIDKNVKFINGDFFISHNNDIYFNVFNNKNFISLYTDVVMQRSGGDAWSILFAGNINNHHVVIPDSLKIRFKASFLKIARTIGLQELDSVEKDDNNYYYVINNNKDIKSINYTKGKKLKLTYINLANIEEIIRIENWNTKEITLPDAKRISKLTMNSLRRLNIPAIETIDNNALETEYIKELILPSRLCNDIDSLQKTCIKWGIRKFIKRIITLNDSTSAVVFDKRYYPTLSTDTPEISHDTIYNHCSYDKKTLKISKDIHTIDNNAFATAINLEELYVDTENKNYISINNTIRRRNSLFHIITYAKNSKSIILSGDYKGDLEIGDSVKEITLFCPEVINSYIGNNLDNIVLRIPPNKDFYISQNIKNRFKKVEYISGYELAYHNIVIAAKKQLTTSNNVYIVMLFLSAMLLFAIFTRNIETKLLLISTIVLYPLVYIINVLMIMNHSIRINYSIIFAITVILAGVLTTMLMNFSKRKNNRL